MLAILNLIAAFNGALIGLVLLAQERFGPARTRVTLACFLLIVSALLALFVLLDTGQVTYSPPLGVIMDLAALLTAALILDYVATSVMARGFGFWPYLPIGLYLLAALINGGRIGDPTDFRLMIAVQIAYSAVALIVYLRARAALPPGWTRRPEHLHLPMLLTGLGLLHVAQLLRLFAPDSSFFYDLVPLAGALGLLAFAVYAMIGSQTLRSLTVQRGPNQPDDEFGAALDATMSATRAFLDPDLSLPKAAAMLKTEPQHLSTYLNTVRRVNFRAYVNSLRIAEAKRLLTAPNEAKTSVEAIAKLAGFRSRSAFYAAFQSETGTSPQDFRVRNLSG